MVRSDKQASSSKALNLSGTFTDIKFAREGDMTNLHEAHLLNEMEREVVAPHHLRIIRKILGIPNWEERLLMNILIREVKAGLTAAHLGLEDDE